MSNYIRLKNLIRELEEEVGPVWRRGRYAERRKELEREQTKGPGNRSGHGVARDGEISQDGRRRDPGAGPQSTSAPVQPPAVQPKSGEPSSKEDEFTQDIEDLNNGPKLKPASPLGALVVKAFDQPLDTGEDEESEEEKGEEGEENDERRGEVGEGEFKLGKNPSKLRRKPKGTGVGFKKGGKRMSPTTTPSRVKEASIHTTVQKMKKANPNMSVYDLDMARKELERKFPGVNRRVMDDALMSLMKNEAVSPWANPIFTTSQFNKLTREFTKKTGIKDFKSDLAAWKKFLESKGYRIHEGVRLDEARYKHPDLRKNHTKSRRVKDGVVYVKGPVLQVWWKRDVLGRPMPGTKGRETWTFDNEQQAMQAWKDFEGVDEIREGVTGPSLMQVRSRAIALVRTGLMRMALETQLRKEFPGVKKGVLNQAMRDAQRTKHGPLPENLWREVIDSLPEAYKGNEETVTDADGNAIEVDEDKFRTAQKTEPTDVQQMDQPFNVETKEGPAKGEAGDYLARGVDGEEWPIDQEIFDKTHEFVDEVKGLAAPDFETVVDIDEARKDPAFKHQLKIARDTLKMTPAMARVMGGMTHDEARAFLKKHGLKEAKGKRRGGMFKTTGSKEWGKTRKKGKHSKRNPRRPMKKAERRRGKEQAMGEDARSFGVGVTGDQVPSLSIATAAQQEASTLQNTYAELTPGNVRQVRPDLHAAKNQNGDVRHFTSKKMAETYAESRGASSLDETGSMMRATDFKDPKHPRLSSGGGTKTGRDRHDTPISKDELSPQELSVIDSNYKEIMKFARKAFESKPFPVALRAIERYLERKGVDNKHVGKISDVLAAFFGMDTDPTSMVVPKAIPRITQEPNVKGSGHFFGGHPGPFHPV